MAKQLKPRVASAVAGGRCRPAADRRTDKRAHAGALLKEAGLVLIDLDGCLAFGNVPHPAAPDLLHRLAGRYAIVSNNSTETPEGLARVLAGNGLAVDPHRILLAGSLMVDLLAREYTGGRVTLLANGAIRDYAQRAGIRNCARGAEVVALARDTTLTHAKLSAALAAVHRGARLFVSNPDLTHPGPEGLPVMETGAILQLFRACVPALEYTVVGKPSRTIFDIALARFGCSATKAVMIGDNSETDGAGATNVGITPILVGPEHAYSSISALL
jgi:HAD superfamily hydrolase (TIGR01450 family)